MAIKTDAELIAEHIAKKGVTKCPTVEALGYRSSPFACLYVRSSEPLPTIHKELRQKRYHTSTIQKLH